MAGLIRKRRFPIVGDGGGVWSHVHIEDAAAATAIAVEAASRASTTSSMTSPRRAQEWLPVLARHWMPSHQGESRWLGRLAAGEMAMLMMTEVRGASNAKMRELGWHLRYPSWRLGVTKGLG